MRLALLAVFLALPLQAQRREPLKTADYLLWSATSALALIDWGQTHDIARQPNRYTESNILLGKHPSHGRVNAVFVVGLTANALVSRLKKREHRRLLWAVVFGGELVAVLGNHRGGLKWRMAF